MGYGFEWLKQDLVFLIHGNFGVGIQVHDEGVEIRGNRCLHLVIRLATSSIPVEELLLLTL